MSILEALRQALRILEGPGVPSTPERTRLLEKLRGQIADLEGTATPSAGPKPPRTQKTFRDQTRPDFERDEDRGG